MYISLNMSMHNDKGLNLLIDFIPLECFFSIKGHAALFLQLISGRDLVHVPIDRSTHFPAYYSQAALLNTYPIASVSSREAVYIIFMTVFGMTKLGRESTTYGMRVEHTDQ